MHCRDIGLLKNEYLTLANQNDIKVIKYQGQILNFKKNHTTTVLVNLLTLFNWGKAWKAFYRSVETEIKNNNNNKV